MGSREDNLETVRTLLEGVEDTSRNRKFDHSKLGVYAANLLSQVLSSPKVVEMLQNLLQLGGTRGAIHAGPMEIYKNIGARAGIAKTAASGAQVLASLPAVYKLFLGFYQLIDACASPGINPRKFDEARSSFEEVAGIPGFVSIIENAIRVGKGELLSQEEEKDVSTARDSLITIVSAGLPNTIDLLVDLGYELAGKGYVSKSQRFRMDPSVLDDLSVWWPKLRVIWVTPTLGNSWRR